jgi:L-histidine Nalpha-methyltransferase
MTAIAPRSPDSRFMLLGSTAATGDFAADVRQGLTGERKSLPPRWFYDELGSSLFDTICFLPEYYVLRAEAEVLVSRVHEIVDALGVHARLIELGSGSARKTRILLDAITARQRALEYVPVDVDAAMLERSGRDLLTDYPALRVTAICGDFTRPSVPLASLSRPLGRTVVLFLGSTIGNLEPDQAAAMLGDLRSALHPGDALLLGADLRKDPSILEPAYNDALGVTAAFNLNLLQRINRELGGDFDLAAFDHHAFYDRIRGRIEMHLLSRSRQTVRIEALHLDVHFDAGESIHTENSYKHDEQSIGALAAGSGFAVQRTWTDSRKWFADVLLTAI